MCVPDVIAHFRAHACMHACCQCPVVQNLLAVLIEKCWSGTGEHIPYIIGTGFWKFPKCVFCNNRVFSPMREECVSSWVSDSFVHRSSLSHRQLGLEVCLRVGCIRSHCILWLVGSVIRARVERPGESQMLTHVDGKLSRMSDGLRPRYVRKR